METYVSLILCVVLSIGVASDIGDPKITKQYRIDYVYNKKTDAFYKLHIESRNQVDIKQICQIEGADLVSPHLDEDINQIHIMIKRFPDLGDVVWVADDGQDHESAEEQPIIDLTPKVERRPPLMSSRCLVVTREGKVETMSCMRSLPFICKVKAKDAPYDHHCKVFAQDYKYFDSVGSCYKMPRIAYTWSEAYSECQAENAHLVVLNSETEREIVQNITLSEPAVPNSQTTYFFLAGFRTLSPPAPTEFKTIFNETLREAGFSQWSANEPNNANGRENCGSIFKNDGLLNDVECTDHYGFICEKEIKKV